MAKNETKKVAELSPKATEVLGVIRSNPDGLTVADLKAMGVNGVNSSHLTALVDRGLITSEKVIVEVVTTAKREVNRYTAIKGE